MPYLLLAGAAVLMLAAAFWLGLTPLRLWTFLTTGGAITLGDLLVNAVLHMYRYKPGFLTEYPDNYLGVLIAECLFVPAYYTLLSLVKGRYRLIVYVAGVLPILLLEELFLWLGIYVHRTWTLWHSAVLFTLYSAAAAYGANAFERRGYTPGRRFLLIAATMYFLMNIWALLPFGTLPIVRMHLGLVKSAEMDHVYTSFLLHAVPFSLTGIAGTWFRLTRRPLFLGAVGTAFFLWITLLARLGIWTADPMWTPWLGGLLVALSLALLATIDRWFEAHAPPPRPRIPPWEPPVPSKRKAP